MENIKKLIVPIINKRFIFHLNDCESIFEVLIMEKNGSAFARAYWYKDDNTSIYLNWLTVSDNIRKKGIGTKLQEIREQIGIKIGATNAYLQVENNSWMHSWYKRRGYTECKNDEIVDNLVWMNKSLI